MLIKSRYASFGLGLVWALALAGVHAADERTDSGPVRLVRNVATGSTNQVATVSFGAGVRNCAQRIDLVTNFLTQGTNSSALLFLPERDPDNNMVSVSMEVKATALPVAYASATFSPNTAVGCATEYETVQYWSEPCSAVMEKTFKGAIPSGLLGSDISVLTIGASARVFLIRSTSTSCVSIKKEVLN